MKMSDSLYQELKADCKTYVGFTRPNGPQDVPSTGDMWGLFHVIMFDRMNDDTHPAFVQRKKTRYLPFWSKAGETRAMQGNDHWLNRFYVDEGLNDSHIETALKKIARELWG